MSSKSSSSTIDNNSSSIRSEILRFESVHPNIYAIYDLIDSLYTNDSKSNARNLNLVANSLKEYVVGIEDAFVNSQEWTLSNNVPDIKLGILGSVKSGKSALIHRYLTGSYVHDDSPEGGRFKKEILIEDRSHLLLIRDEGGPPDEQFSNWIDGVILVFSTDNEESFQTISEYYSRLLIFRSNDDFPIVLVGTMDYNSESKTRVIDEVRARKLANDLNHCPYFESCATYGYNVDNVIQEACNMIIQSRRNNNSLGKFYPCQTPVPPPRDGSITANQGGNGISQMMTRQSFSHQHFPLNHRLNQQINPSQLVSNMQSLSLNKNVNMPIIRHQNSQLQPLIPHNPQQQPPFVSRQNDFDADDDNSQEAIGRDVTTPGSTPTQMRKNRRKSNLFNNKDKKDNRIGSGRAIPLKQGILYKRRTKPLNKEWKSKKYVTLTDDGRLTYHPSIHEYMENIHGKEIDLCRTTVKIPGIAFRQAGSLLSSSTKITTNGIVSSCNQNNPSENIENEFKDNASEVERNEIRKNGLKDSSSAKKRQRRIKSNPKSGIVDDLESEGYEFQLISLDRTWCFEAPNTQERDEWVALIEHTTMSRLQSNDSNKAKTTSTSYLHSSTNSFTDSITAGSGGHHSRDKSVIQSERDGFSKDEWNQRVKHIIQGIPGNNFCADCANPDPDWASINLGCLVCIECSGSHRQLGTHISRIKSISLDDWNSECLEVMQAIGNTLSNSIWEAAISAANKKKPQRDCRREEKEAWIKAKYERKEFLPPLPYPDAALQQQLMDAIARQDTRQVILCLAMATPEIVNSPYSRHDSRASIHIAATLGSIVYLQLLLWYNGNPSITDSNGRNAFYYAHCSQKYDCAQFLLRNGCPRQEVPLPGITMISTANSVNNTTNPSNNSTPFILAPNGPDQANNNNNNSFHSPTSTSSTLLGNSSHQNSLLFNSANSKVSTPQPMLHNSQIYSTRIANQPQPLYQPQQLPNKPSNPGTPFINQSNQQASI